MTIEPMVDLDWTSVDAQRAQMAATGAVEIPNFVRPEALPAFVEDARRLAPLAHRSGGLGTVYLGFPDESFPTDHPQQWLGDYSVGAVAYDLFPSDSLIRQLYEWEPLLELVAAIMDSRPHPEHGYRACLGVMRLRKRFPDERIERACARALALRAVSYRSVESILKKGLDQAPVPGSDPSPAPPAMGAHENVRGPTYFH